MALESFTIPDSLPERFDYQRNATEIIPGNATAWGVPAPLVEELIAAHLDYEKTCVATTNSGVHNPIATAAREKAWALLKVTLSEIYEKYLLYNDAIDSDTRIALHIHPLAGGGAGTITPAPRTTPIVTLSLQEISVLHVMYSDSATPSSHAKPDGVAFCEFAYKIDLPAPETPKDCTERFFISRSNTAMVFEPEQRAKRIYGFARWVNKNSKTGPWSDVITAIIP